MTVKELFDFVIDPSIADDDVDDYLEKVQQKVLERGESYQEDSIEPTVFVQTLDYVKNCEEDLAMHLRPAMGYKDMSKKTYDKLLLGLYKLEMRSLNNETQRVICGGKSVL